MLSIKHIPIRDVFLQQQLNYLEYLPFSPICMWLWVYGSKKIFVLQVPKIEWPDKILMFHSRLKVSTCTYQKMCNYRNSFIPLHAWREVEKCGEFYTDMWIMLWVRILVVTILLLSEFCILFHYFSIISSLYYVAICMQKI